MRRKYDEYGRLIQETAPTAISPATVMIIHTVTSPAQRRCHRQPENHDVEPLRSVAEFTDCSGYVTRYDHDRFGQVTRCTARKG